jgi:DNA-directed RNA polymerase specialized sigma24 family protein
MGSLSRTSVAPPVTVPVLRGGAEGSFDSFYASSWTMAVRIGTMLTGSREAAEEIVQEAFIGLHERWAQVDNPAGYLKAAVANGAKNYLRKRSLRLSRGWGWGRDVPSELEANELWDALRALPTRQRLAVVLKYYGDLPTAEIAAVLRCPEGTASSLIHRGTAALRKALGQ